jgi:hypothetical protein
VKRKEGLKELFMIAGTMAMEQTTRQAAVHEKVPEIVDEKSASKECC